MLLPFLWIAAFIFSLPLFEAAEIARLLAVTCAVFAAGLTVVCYGVPRWSAVVAAGAAFWALAAVSVALSDIPYLSFIAFCTFSLMPLSAVAFVAAPERAVRVAAAGAGLVLGALALWAVAQYLFFKDMLVFGQVRAPFASPNSYAALLAAGIFPALGAAMTVKGRGRAALLLLAGLLACAVVVIGSRAVTVLLLPGLVLFWILSRGNGGGMRGAVTVVAAGMIAGLLVALTGESAAVLRTVDAEGAGALFGRGAVWQGALAMVRDHALTGTGMGMFSQYYPAYRLAADTASGGYMAHSDPLQFAAEMGVFAPVLFYAFIGAALWRMARGGHMNGWGAGVVAGLGVIVAHAHVDFDFYVASILCLSGLMLGAWYRQAGAEVVAPRGRAVVLVPMAAALLLLQGLLIADYHTGQARAAALRGDMDVFGAHVNDANRKGFGMDAQAYAMAATVPMGLMHGAAMKARPALYDQAAGLLDRAGAANPRLVTVPFYRAKLAALYTPDGARTVEEWLGDALALNPQHTPSRVMLAQRLQAAGRADESYAVLLAGLDWNYGTAEAQEFYDEVGMQALKRRDMDTFRRMSEGANALQGRLRKN